jgi:bacterioferritin
MKGKAKVLELLNDSLSEELTAINQYMLHGEMCENWGYDKLAALDKKHAIDEMKHAETLVERILFLEGIPNMSNYQKLNIGANIPDMLKNDLASELGAVAAYNKRIALSSDAGDYGTAEMLKKLLEDEEGHVDKLEEQLDLIKDMGLANYLMMQAGK